MLTLANSGSSAQSGFRPSRFNTGFTILGFRTYGSMVSGLRPLVFGVSVFGGLGFGVLVFGVLVFGVLVFGGLGFGILGFGVFGVWGTYFTRGKFVCATAHGASDALARVSRMRVDTPVLGGTLE